MVAVDPNAMQTDNGGSVLAATYVFIILTILTTVLRITLGTIRKRTFGIDDILLIAAVPLALLSAICTGNAVVNGLGRSIAFVHSGQLSNYFKLSYSAQIFTILTMAVSKHSVVVLIQRVTPYNSTAQRYIRWMHPVIGSWMFFAVFGIAFQCSFPSPWIYQPSRCTGHGAIWYPVVVVSMIIDIVLALGFIPATKDTQIDPKKKNKITGLFLCRLIVPVMSIAHIAVLSIALESEDQTSAMTNPAIFDQVTMNLSVITAAILAISRTVSCLEPSSPAGVVSEITSVPLDASHSRTTSAENNRLRDWAFAQLRNSPTPNSLVKDISLEPCPTPQQPERAQISLERVSTAPPVPPRSTMRSKSPRLTLDFQSDDTKDSWFVGSNRSSAMTDLSTLGGKRISTRNDIAV